MDSLEHYYQAAGEILRRIQVEESEKIQEAGRLVAESLAQGRLLRVIGTGGHSYMGAEEMFYRAGGLVPVDAMLDPGFSLGSGARRSTLVERTPGYVKVVLDYHQVQRGDVLLIVNAYGINAATIEAALEAKARGLTSIAVTSSACARPLALDHPSRHPSGLNLFEIADLFIDTKVSLGDAAVDVEGCDQRVGPLSTIANSFAVNSIVVAAVQHLVRLGVQPPVWKSSNSPGGDEANQRYLAEYFGKLKYL